MLARTAARGPGPANLRDELLHMAVRGLGYVDHLAGDRSPALRSLEGRLRPVADGVDLVPPPTAALEVRSLLARPGSNARSRGPGHRRGAPPAASPADSNEAGPLGAASQPGVDLDPRGTDFVFASSFDPAHTNVRNGPRLELRQPASRTTIRSPGDRVGHHLERTLRATSGKANFSYGRGVLRRHRAAGRRGGLRGRWRWPRRHRQRGRDVRGARRLRRPRQGGAAHQLLRRRAGRHQPPRV